MYTQKGCGFLENVYHECLAIELSERQIPFVSKPELRLDYKGRKLDQSYKPDFLCFGKKIVELKAVRSLAAEHRAQTINYLKATGLKLGVLVNFGHHPKVEYERFVNQSASLTSR